MRKKIALFVSVTAGLVVAPIAGGTRATATVLFSCFICDNWYDTYGNPRHNDYPLFFNDRQGTDHGSGGWGTCGQHAFYTQGGGGGGGGGPKT